ncbi:MAG: monovalent cation:proton antiporter-2 (CPA2) family protein [Alphaproteobacteria bacterium]
MSEAGGHGIEAHVLRDVLVFLLAALVAVPLFARLRASPVLAYLFAGVLIGPGAMGLVRSEAGTAALAELGIVFLLFTVGLELSLDRLRSLARLVFGLGGLQVALTSWIIGALCYWLYPNPAVALVVGGALALSSTAVVLQILAERREMNTGFGRASFAVLLLQDLSVVPLLAVMPLLSGEQPVLVALGEAAVRAVLAIAIIVVIGRLLLRPVYRIVAQTRSPELFACMTLLAVLATALLASLAGLSMALGAFLAGLLLAETEFRHQVELDIAPFKGLLLGLFFITVGMTIDPGMVLRNLHWLAAGAAALMLLKGAVVGVLAAIFRLPGINVLQCGVLLCQGGEFAFVIFGQAVVHDLMAPEAAQMLSAAVVLSMAATPLLHAATQRLAARVAARRQPETDQLAAAAHDLRRHVVIAGFGRVGQTVATLLERQAIPYVALDLDARRVNEGVIRRRPVFFGDSARPEILRAAGVANAAALVLTLDDSEMASRVLSELRRLEPDLPVVARARDQAHADQLTGAGADVVVPEMLEASLQLAALVLESTGLSRQETADVVAEVRAEHYSPIAGETLADADEADGDVEADDSAEDATSQPDKTPAPGETKRDG